MSQKTIFAPMSSTGSLCGWLPEHADRILADDGRLFLIFGSDTQPTIEAAASTADEAVIAEGAGVIAEGMLTDSELLEFEEHEVVAVGGLPYEYWRTDARGMKWLRRIEGSDD